MRLLITVATINCFLLGVGSLANEFERAVEASDPTKIESQQALKDADSVENEALNPEDALSQSSTVPSGTFPELPEALTRPETLHAIQEVMAQTADAQPSLPNPPSGRQVPAVYVFISFSMPEASIKAWLEQARLADAAVVLRGLVNNSLTDTMKAVSDLYGADQQRAEAALIDPTLYARFGIDQVPAVVVTATAADPCMKIDCPTPEFLSVFGDVPLRYALDKLSLSMPKVRPALKVKMEALQPGRTW